MKKDDKAAAAWYVVNFGRRIALTCRLWQKEGARRNPCDIPYSYT